MEGHARYRRYRSIHTSMRPCIYPCVLAIPMDRRSESEINASMHASHTMARLDAVGTYQSWPFGKFVGTL